MKTRHVGPVLNHIRLCAICRQPWGIKGVGNLEAEPYKRFLGDCHGEKHCLHQLDGLPNLQTHQ
jgi:hypothetical protein